MRKLSFEPVGLELEVAPLELLDNNSIAITIPEVEIDIEYEVIDTATGKRKKKKKKKILTMSGVLG